MDKKTIIIGLVVLAGIGTMIYLHKKRKEAIAANIKKESNEPVKQDILQPDRLDKTAKVDDLIVT